MKEYQWQSAWRINQRRNEIWRNGVTSKNMVAMAIGVININGEWRKHRRKRKKYGEAA
jgi:hypothetical protein